MKNIMAIYPSHDASVCVMTKDGKYRVFEIERLIKERFATLQDKNNYKEIYDQLKAIIQKECGVDYFDKCYHLQLKDSHKAYLKEIFNINEFEETYHHISHAACSFYQSPFEEALIISYDGGGYDGNDDHIGFFNVYTAKRAGPITRIKRVPIDLGTAYGLIGVPISEINKTKENWGNKFLSYAGKIMGLVAYGTVNHKWVEPLYNFYKATKNPMSPKYHRILCEYLNSKADLNCYSGEMSYNLAATSQLIFEKIFFEETDDLVRDYAHLPICLTGGCALNVILNQKIKSRIDPNRNLFIPPNPSDCGLAFGMIALHEKPKRAVDLTYSGMPILDIEELPNYIDKYKARKIDNAELARLLFNGNIIGVMHGNSEHGPRALGNRSILCNPGLAHMKDTLNSKVKFREWFRPFAPVVRQENVNRYFKFTGESRFMSYSPLVNKDWIDKLPAIVHKDNTARVQTVTKQQNEFLYDLLGEFEKLSSYDVLLNTSFNIKGLPILTTIKDAIEVLETTEIDAVMINNYLFTRIRGDCDPE